METRPDPEGNDGPELEVIERLARAATSSGYTSEIANHAYTIALHQTGNMAKLADVAYQIGHAHLKSDAATSMDYFQRALYAGLDTERIRAIADIYKGWMPSGTSREVRLPVTRVAHVIGRLAATDSVTRYLEVLVPVLNLAGMHSTIFTTEAAASWFSNRPGLAESQIIEIQAETVIADVACNFLDRAEQISSKIVASGIPVALFHGDIRDQIATRVAAFRPAPIQINVNHSNRENADLFDACVHLTPDPRLELRFESQLFQYIPMASNAEARLRLCEPLTRQSLGLETTATVSATFGPLEHSAGKGYLQVLTELMRRYPKHVHLFAGEGDVRAIRGFFHSQGVLPRIRFLGVLKDVLPLFGLVDVYLASFPQTSAEPILESMAAERPVIVMKSSGDELVGIKGLIAANEPEYLEIADRILRTPNLRAKHGSDLRNRFRQEFYPQLLGERYARLIERIATSPKTDNQ